MGVLEQKRFEIGCKVIGQQRLELVLEESLELPSVQVDIHRVSYLLIHLEIGNHLQGLYINPLSYPHDLL